MENIKIASKLYDYEVVFIKNVKKEMDNIGNICTYVIDKKVYELFPDIFQGIDKDKIFFVDAVETKKNINTVLELIYFWKKAGVRKNWKILCFGGGITQDITTFASNIFLRNMEWYFFPTTLLAMVDSCIGGKCGINLEEYKNQLGVFYPPRRIFIYEKFLDTLSEADYINGWGEILKFSLTEESDFFEILEKEGEYIPCAEIGKYIYKGLQVKKNIIEQDEFEGDLRRVLNYGHTFGHALESYTNHRIPHGTAVIWGMDVVNYIACRKNILEWEVYKRIKHLIKKEFIKDEIVIEQPENLFEIIKTDKKVKDNVIYLVFLERISHLGIYPQDISIELKTLFLEYLEETHDYYCN